MIPITLDTKVRLTKRRGNPQAWDGREYYPGTGMGLPLGYIVEGYLAKPVEEDQPLRLLWEDPEFEYASGILSTGEVVTVAELTDQQGWAVFTKNGSVYLLEIVNAKG